MFVLGPSEGLAVVVVALFVAGVADLPGLRLVEHPDVLVLCADLDFGFFPLL